jgi:hypothetical protein
MNISDISTQLLFTTVPIWIEKRTGPTMSATAFIYNFPVAGQQDQFIPVLVTNEHVVKDAKSGLIELVQRAGDLPDKSNRVRIGLDGPTLTQSVDERLDLAAIPFGPILNQLQAAGRPIFFRSVGPDLVPPTAVLEDLAAMEEVVFIGYPSGLRDEHNATPLIRRGITATPPWNDFENTPTFLLDAGVFPGSSGSPVFVLNQGAYATRNGLTIGNRLLFLGVITQSVVRVDGGITSSLGLGKAVRSTSVQTFIERTVARVGSPTSG